MPTIQAPVRTQSLATRPLPPLYTKPLSPPIQTPASAERFPSCDKVAKGALSLKRGNRSACSKEVQAALHDMGFWTGGGTSANADGTYGKADGIFGSKMQNAVKNFQSSQNLKVTGVVDQKTYLTLAAVAPAVGEKIWDASYAQRHPEQIPQNTLPNQEKARVVIDLSENRLFLFEKNSSRVKGVYSVAVGKIDYATTGRTLTRSGYKKVDSKVYNPSWLGEQLYQKPDIFGPKLLGLGDYDYKTGHVRNSDQEIHGTNNENSIGLDASSGCIRMHNAAIEQVFSQVEKGEIVYIKD